MSVKHRFVSAKSDGADPTLVRASNWNDTHVVVDDFVNIIANYSVLVTDEFIKATAGTGITLTLPSAVGIQGKSFTVKRIDTGSGAVTLATTSGQTIDGVTSYLLTNQWQVITVTSDGSNWLIKGQN